MPYHAELSVCFVYHIMSFNTLRPRQDGRHFADAIFTCNFFNENCCILINFSLKYVRKGPIDNNAALVQIMAWRRSGDKPLSETMMISLPMHICVTRPQCDNVHNIPCLPVYHASFSAENLALAGFPPTSAVGENMHVRFLNMFNLCLCSSATIWYFL